MYSLRSTDSNNHLSIMQIKTVLLSLAVMSGGCMLSCTSDDLTVSRDESYTREFIKTFGVASRSHDWNLAVHSSVPVITTAPTNVRVYAEVSGRRYLFADYRKVTGSADIPLTLPKSVSEVIVSASGRETRVALGQSVDLTLMGRTVADAAGEGGSGITAELITDRSQWMVVPMLNATIFRRKMPENCYNPLREGVHNDFMMLFKENDIIVFKSVQNEYENEYSNLYYLLRFSQQNKYDNDIYKFLDKIIENSNLNRGHAIVNEKINLIEEKISEIELQENIDIIVPTQVIERTREFIGTASSIENLFNSQSFRDFVMVGYGNKCAVTGKSIIWKKFINLEAAHIMPRSHNGTYMPNNGLALSRDIHWAFDKGFFTINDDYTIKVHEELMNTYLGEFEGKKINLPENPFFIPNKESLKYHREKIFGLFKYSGRISSVNSD